MGFPSLYEDVVEKLTSRLHAMQGGLLEAQPRNATLDRFRADLQAAEFLIRDLNELSQNLQHPEAERAKKLTDLSRRVGVLESDKTSLQNRLAAAHEKLSRIENENARMSAQLLQENASLRDERRRLKGLLEEAEKQIKQEERRGHAKRMYRGVPKKNASQKRR